MKPARVSAAVLTALVTAALAWFALDLWTRQGGRLLPLPWFAAIAIGLVAAVVLVLGWEVRRSVRGQRTTIDPLFAARVVVLAKAAVFGGAVLAGWYAAQALVLLSNVSGLRRERLLVAGVTAVAAVALAVAGFVAQRWCRLPDDDEPGGRDEEDALAPPSPRSPTE